MVSDMAPRIFQNRCTQTAQVNLPFCAHTGVVRSVNAALRFGLCDTLDEIGPPYGCVQRCIPHNCKSNLGSIHRPQKLCGQRYSPKQISLFCGSCEMVVRREWLGRGCAHDLILVATPPKPTPNQVPETDSSLKKPTGQEINSIHCCFLGKAIGTCHSPCC